MLVDITCTPWTVAASGRKMLRCLDVYPAARPMVALLKLLAP